MKLLFLRLVLISAAIITTSCIRGNKEKESKPLIFQPPSVPVVIGSQEEAIHYQTVHYWDHFPFEDSLCIIQEGFADQVFTGYANLLQQADIKDARESIRRMMIKAGTAAEDPAARKKILLKFFSLTEYFFYHPNSPYRNDDILIPALEVVVAAPLLDSMEIQRPLYMLDIVRKNRPGDIAGDFSFIRAVRNFPFTDDPSNIENLHDLKSDFILIMFINLGCPSCNQVKEEILHSEPVKKMVEEKRLTILTVYPDKDMEGWQKHLPELPAEWIHSYNPEGEIRNGSIYDLKAIPTLYLLDKNKRVLVKDALSVKQLEDAIRQQAYFL
ncbi:MAG TPA: DUF5106 domain-containing protein [Bacteroidales bacterium]|nr:DUF5106 domain-containing protein [Bacteroidales bacterium]HRW94361.1 DUF5106 domain-containing protein [Bacteroidales bacterium]